MSKLKKVLLMCTAYVLVAALAIGGTIAYLQDTDSDVNVMTLGNVSIAQHEYQRATNEDGTYKTATIDEKDSYVLEAFEQAKPLLPATDPSNNGAGGWDTTTVRMSQVDSYGGMDVFVNPNAQDKFVTVENTGKTDAYVRTLVAIEVGSTDGSLIGSSFHTTWTNNEIGIIEINGNNYYVTEYVYRGGAGVRHENGVLPAGDTSYPSLAQVYLNSKATNDDMKAIDGNSNGTLDILVLSQAVQTAGFENAATALDTAFGKSSEKAAEWFGGTVIPKVVKDDITSSGTGYGHFTANGEITIFDNVDIVTSGGGISVWGTAEFNGGSIVTNSTSTSGRHVFYVASDGGVQANGHLTINGGEFTFSPTNLTRKGYYICADGEGAMVIVNGGTFGKPSTRTNYKAGIAELNGGKVIIKGGTFGFDPSAWVADGYEAVQNGSVWTVSAK